MSETNGDDSLPYRRRHSAIAADQVSQITRAEIVEMFREWSDGIKRDRKLEMENSELKHAEKFRDLIKDHLTKEEITRIARDLDHNFVPDEKITERIRKAIEDSEVRNRAYWSAIAEGVPTAEPQGNFWSDLRKDISWARKGREEDGKRDEEQQRRARENAAKSAWERMFDGASWLKQMLALIATAAVVYGLARYGIIPKP